MGSPRFETSKGKSGQKRNSKKSEMKCALFQETADWFGLDASRQASAGTAMQHASCISVFLQAAFSGVGGAVQPQDASTIWGPVRWSVACGRMVCSGTFCGLARRCKRLGARLRLPPRYERSGVGQVRGYGT